MMLLLICETQKFILSSLIKARQDSSRKAGNITSELTMFNVGVKLAVYIRDMLQSIPRKKITVWSDNDVRNLVAEIH